MDTINENINPIESLAENGDENLALPNLAAGLMRLSDEERKTLEAIITPEAAQLLAKAFGPEFWQILSPLLQDDNPEDKQAAEQELRRMMRDPRYWRDKDGEVMRKVTDGFRRLYPE